MRGGRAHDTAHGRRPACHPANHPWHARASSRRKGIQGGKLRPASAGRTRRCLSLTLLAPAHKHLVLVDLVSANPVMALVVHDDSMIRVHNLHVRFVIHAARGAPPPVRFATDGPSASATRTRIRIRAWHCTHEATEWKRIEPREERCPENGVQRRTPIAADHVVGDADRNFVAMHVDTHPVAAARGSV